MEYFLSSKRLGFRIWAHNDFHSAKRLWGNHEVSRYIDSRGKLSEDQILEKFEKEIETEKTFGIQYWPVFLLNNNQNIGCCGLRPYNVNKRINEIGVHILPDYWRKGFATESAKACLEYGFRKLGLNLIIARTSENNCTSQKVLVKIGMIFWKKQHCAGIGQTLYYKVENITAQKNLFIADK